MRTREATAILRPKAPELPSLTTRQETPSPFGTGFERLLTHCCGHRDSKDSRSFSHWAASSACLSKHCQNSSRAPQQAFLSSIVGAADIAAAHLNANSGSPGTAPAGCGTSARLAASAAGPDAALPRRPKAPG